MCANYQHALWAHHTAEAVHFYRIFVTDQAVPQTKTETRSVSDLSLEVLGLGPNVVDFDWSCDMNNHV